MDMCEVVGARDPALETKVEHIAEASLDRMKEPELRLLICHLRAQNEPWYPFPLFSAGFVDYSCP